MTSNGQQTSIAVLTSPASIFHAPSIVDNIREAAASALTAPANSIRVRQCQVLDRYGFVEIDVRKLAES